MRVEDTLRVACRFAVVSIEAFASEVNVTPVSGLEGFENVPGPQVLPFCVEQFRPVNKTLPPATGDTGVRSSIFRSPGFGWTMSSRTWTLRISSPGIVIGISRLWPVFAQHGIASAGEKDWS